ncbi:MAG: hypothetical protein IJT25_02035 [Clostridia bacterium]|nr:hypothetical protein [Clostridia bacterium]
MVNKNGINPVFVATLAVLPLINVAFTLQEVVLLGLVSAFTYIIAISLISILEKVANRNLRFFVFMIIACAIVTVFNYVYAIFPNVLYVEAGSKINYCLISAGILSIETLYSNRKMALTGYFYKMLMGVPAFLGIYFLFGSIREILGLGSVWGVELGFQSIEFFKTSYGAFILLALICSFINSFYLHSRAKKHQYNMLVEKYKMKLSMERNIERTKAVDASQRKNFGADELIEKNNGENGGNENE